jgi:hypothetical protein
MVITLTARQYTTLFSNEIVNGSQNNGGNRMLANTIEDNELNLSMDFSDREDNPNMTSVSVTTTENNVFQVWKSKVHEDLQSKKRGYSRRTIRKLKKRLNQIDDWSSASNSTTTNSKWKSVSSEEFHFAAMKARETIEPLVDQVYTDCRLWILPSKKQHRQPKLKFQCNLLDYTSLQEEPCHDMTLCLVATDMRLWKSSNSSSTPPYSERQSFQTRFLTPNPHNDKLSVLLTLVDSTSYLKKGTIWESFLNKASYSLLSQRPLFILVGRVPSNVLNQRETFTVSSQFGVTCHSPDETNAMHYVKPIAFLALFHKQTIIPSISTAFFVDADIYFNTLAYDNINNTTLPTLEEYFTISSQASIVGSQNPSGNDGNILFNGGFLGLRNTDYTYDFAALWWFCRCGPRDQIALWLVLFVTWSATSYELLLQEEQAQQQPDPFSFPVVLFENYIFAWYGVMAHSRRYLKQLQELWIDGTGARSRKKLVPAVASVDPSSSLTHIMDGGKDFFNSSSLSEKLRYPLELPHVLIVPITPFELPRDDESFSTRTKLSFPGLITKTQNKETTLFSHNKYPTDVCTDDKCWPYIISHS